MSISIQSSDGSAVIDPTIATLAQAVAAASVAGKKILVKSHYTISANLTVPSNIELEIGAGGLLTINGGVTLTINGPFTAVTQRVFAVTGAVTGLGYADPRWFGAAASNAASANNLLIQNAIDSVAALSGKIMIPAGVAYTSALAWKGVKCENIAAPLMINYVSGTAPGLKAGVSADREFLYSCDYSNNTIDVYDVSDRRNPRLNHNFAVSASPRHCQAIGRFLFVCCHYSSKVEIYDIESPHIAGGSPVATINTVGSNVKMFVVEGYFLYVLTNANARVEKWDIADPLNPVAAGYKQLTQSDPISISHYNGVCVVTGHNMVLETFTEDLAVGPWSYTLPTGPSHEVMMVGSTVFVSDDTNGALLVMDVSDPTSPAYITSVSTGTHAIAQMNVVGNKLYGAGSNISDASGGWLYCFDITNPYAPYLFKVVPLNTSGAIFFDILENFAYVAGHFSPYTIDVVELPDAKTARNKVTQPEPWFSNYVDLKPPPTQPLSYTAKTVIAPYTLLADDDVVRVGLGAAITLPDPATMPLGREYVITNVSTTTACTVAQNGTYTWTVAALRSVRLLVSEYSGSRAWDCLG